MIRWASTASVLVLAGIAAVISYKHMYYLVLRYGETSWTAALLPVSVDGMIAVASMSLLVDSRQGRRSGLLPWALLVLGSAASLAANVAVAEPSVVGRLIAAWPSCALIGAYELLMRQIRHTSVRKIESDNAEIGVTSEATHMTSENARRISVATHGPSEKTLRGPRPAPATSEETLRSPPSRPATSEKAPTDQILDLRHSSARLQQRDAVDGAGSQRSSSHLDGTGDADIQRRAWRWAVAHRTPAGDLPPGKAIGSQFGRSERWGRLVKQAGRTGRLDAVAS
ncbi:DUF2637 domain-containing protein [Actinomadura syzygii]|uniref:DUF2637 domain-containing protein n=1 Tax=Actinomadura syzygii TaxID=1427538 RepID=A0A5D0U8S1_9ACTN|nr:DUF2637 domain-containing protein [Actinomadura syzygii]